MIVVASGLWRSHRKVPCFQRSRPCLVSRGQAREFHLGEERLPSLSWARMCSSVCVYPGAQSPILQNENIYCLTYLPLRLRLLVLLLTNSGGVKRAQHTAHHCRASPRAPGSGIGTIELQRTKGEVGFCAHTGHAVQTKGVLLPLGQHPMGTGVRCSRVRLSS